MHLPVGQNLSLFHLTGLKKTDIEFRVLGLFNSAMGIQYLIE